MIDALEVSENRLSVGQQLGSALEFGKQLLFVAKLAKSALTVTGDQTNEDCRCGQRYLRSEDGLKFTVRESGGPKAQSDRLSSSMEFHKREHISGAVQTRNSPKFGIYSPASRERTRSL